MRRESESPLDHIIFNVTTTSTCVGTRPNSAIINLFNFLVNGVPGPQTKKHARKAGPRGHSKQSCVLLFKKKGTRVIYHDLCSLGSSSCGIVPRFTRLQDCGLNREVHDLHVEHQKYHRFTSSMYRIGCRLRQDHHPWSPGTRCFIEVETPEPPTDNIPT